MSENILYNVAAGIGIITFNRPQVMNALDLATIIEFSQMCERAQQDAAARVVVLRGAGRAFLAGGDVAAFQAHLADFPLKVLELAGELHHGILALRRAPKPVIASVHGAVAGAGMSVMMACDLIVAAEGTQFTLAYSKIGTSPDGGATWFLPRLVGHHKAMELLLLADVVDTNTLQALGVLNQVVPVAELESATRTLAQRLAAGPASAYAETKALVNSELNQELERHLEAEAQAFSRCAAHPDFAEGVNAFVAKRQARFG
ncbi:MAG: enoyl-CoA hydratase [Betaproteobacteria bacterium]|nr:enoyl-CoA hydratase [Betaproteobacteria bacterium]